MSEPFIWTYCEETNWEISNIGHVLANGSINDACFQEIALLIPAHFIMSMVCLYKYFRLESMHSLRTHTRCILLTPNDLSIHKCNLFLCLMGACIPLFQLNASIFASGSYSVAVMQIVALCLSFLAWGAVSLVLYTECICMVRKSGRFLMRTVVLIVWCFECFKFITFSRITDDQVEHSGYFIYLEEVQFWGLSIVCALNLFHWPQRYNIVSNNNSDQYHICPEDDASWWDSIWFNWMNELIKQGSLEPLQVKHVWLLGEDDKNEKLIREFQTSWRKQMTLLQPSFYKSVSDLYGFRFYLGGLLRIISDLSQFVGPLFIPAFVSFVDDPEADSTDGYTYAVVIFLSSVFGSIFFCVYYQTVQRVGMQLRSVVYAAIYRKAMHLSHKGRQGLSNGKLVNLMTSDAEALEQACAFFHALWSSLIVIIVCIFLLYVYLGVAAFFGILAMFVVLPFQKRIVAKMMSLTKLILEEADTRTKLVREVLSNMNIVKMYAWEKAFDKKIEEVRNRELEYQKGRAILQSFAVTIVMSIPVIVSVCAFGFFDLLNPGKLDASKAFTANALFNILRGPLAQLPQAITKTIQAKVSLDRLQQLFVREEMEEEEYVDVDKSKPAVIIENGNYFWGNNDLEEEENMDAEELKLKDERIKEQKKKKNIGNGELTQSLLESEYKSDHNTNTDHDNLSGESDISYMSTQGHEYTQLKRIKDDFDDIADLHLKDINISIKHGDLLCVIGVTGSGKSSLLSAILGDMPTVQELVDLPSPLISKANKYNRTVQGRVAYVPQQSFIFNATVKDNIIFGIPFDEKRYQIALETSCLAKDLLLFANGDQTEIGEKGVNLSGGQKQRISLARAVYAQADVYLFDDPLSALDAHVGRNVFENCIEGVLKQIGATRILVTNQVEFLTQCDNIVVMNEGRIVGQGSYSDLKDNETFASIVASQSKHTENNNDDDDEDVEKEEKKEKKEKKKEKGLNMGEAAGSLISEEDRELGVVSFKVVLDYFDQWNNIWGIVFMLILFIGAEAFRDATAFWTTTWTSKAYGEHFSYITFYTIFSVMQCICILIDQLLFAVFSISAARAFHQLMLSTLLRAPMAFFAATPLGRILNRFTKDTMDIDQVIAFQFTIFLQTFLMLIGTMFIISFNTPATLVVAIPVLVLFFRTYMYYQNTSRELKRLDAVTRSPIYAHLSQSLNGLASIRAYKATKRLCDEYSDKIDVNMRMDLAQFSSQQWLTIRLAIMGGFTVFASALACVAFKKDLTGDIVGLTLSMSLAVTGLLNVVVRTASFTENSFNAVERVKAYCILESEAPLIIDHQRPPNNWPSLGHLKMEHAVMKYRPDLPPVLHDISFEIFPGQKLGVVGRTGAGKSSMFACLYRLVELSSGRIFVDDEDISKFGLFDVRKSFAIIPQDPVLFIGTIRSNLDPFDEYCDADVWDSLKRANLLTMIESLSNGLSTIVDEGGTNFSLGQKQLLCLARALLRNSRIVVLDEATAAVDPQTDALIQQTIRTEFKNSTVLTIAHRLNTIMDSDRILVLDAGKIVEFGTPFELLSLPASASSGDTIISEEHVFLSMVDATGAAKSKHMLRVAEEAFRRTENDEKGERVEVIQKMKSDSEREYKEFQRNAKEAKEIEIMKEKIKHSKEDDGITTEILRWMTTLADIRKVPHSSSSLTTPVLREQLEKLLKETEETLDLMR